MEIRALWGLSYLVLAAVAGEEYVCRLWALLLGGMIRGLAGIVCCWHDVRLCQSFFFLHERATVSNQPLPLIVARLVLERPHAREFLCRSWFRRLIQILRRREALRHWICAFLVEIEV